MATFNSESSGTDIVWPCSVTQKSKNKLIALAKVQKLKEHQSFHRTSLDYSVIYVQSGYLNLFIPSEEMESIIGSVVQSGQWCTTELPSFPHNPLNIAALNDAEILVFEGEKIKKLIEGVPEVNMWLSNCRNQCSQRLLHSSFLAKKDKTALLAHVLCSLCSSERNKTNTISISQNQLSDLLGLRRQSINELLQVFQFNKLIKLGRCKIDVCNLKHLNEVAESKRKLSIVKPRKHGCENGSEKSGFEPFTTEEHQSHCLLPGEKLQPDY
ncbi:Crp/Fnr family transcriptional regulator [Vibrio hannami]|uniref:Crp/Fnr family transcriptional regulator n=1 Tax=Vibrio hannami TaxID=2717094 RepID=UPI00240F2616|nr:Crp/Fnr family transcriptional regulator [Vibrio hannami]MDG3087857.1 Crp/Fnr family transcriptional regulator [Vibrio hannami]